MVLMLGPPAAFGQSLNPTGSIAVHDPVMIKEGKTYYLYHSGTLAPTKTSADMVNWSSVGSSLPTPVPAWWSQQVPNREGGDRIWAPDISFRNGIYWLYYALSSPGSQSSAIGLATRTSLASGSWADQGMVITSSSYPVNDNAIDPNIVTDAQGRVWMAWGSWWNGIFIVQLDPATGKPATGATAINIANRGGPGIEGAFIIYARGYYHLFTSWDICCQAANNTYNMRYGRSAVVTGPYVDKAGAQLTSGGGTLLSDGSGYPGGHNAVFQENGDYYLVYHVYDGRNSPASLQIRRLFFDAQGWPTLDPAAGAHIHPVIRKPSWGRVFSSLLFDPLGRRTEKKHVNPEAGASSQLGNLYFPSSS